VKLELCDQDELRTSWYSMSHDLRYVLFKYDVHQVSLFELISIS